MGDRDDPDVMETRLTIDYDKQWLSCVSEISPTQLSIYTNFGNSLPCITCHGDE